MVSLPHGTLAATLAGHSAAINSVRVFPDSSRCVTGSSDCTVRVWRLDDDDAQCSAVLHTDAPVLACDVSCGNIVLYGAEGGWVSTASFQSDPNKPNALISRLNTRESPTNSSSIASPNSVNDRADTLGSDKGNKPPNQHSFQREQPSPTPNPEREAAATETTDLGRSSGTDPPQQHDQNGRATGGPGEGATSEASMSASRSVDGSAAEMVSAATSKETVAHTAAEKSSTCTML